MIDAADILTEDFADPEEERKKEIQRAKNKLSAEIRSLNAQLKFPPEFRLGIAGTGLGFAIGSYPGAIAGALAGFFIGKNRQLTDDEKKLLQNLINQKEQQLQNIGKQLETQNEIMGGVVSAEDLMNLEYDVYEFDDKWEELFGQPSKPFHAMVFGVPKAGKSIFSFQFASYLTQFGDVLYIASEEGFRGTIRDKIKNFAANEDFIADNFRLSDARGLDKMREVIPGNDFVFIDSVNYAQLEVEDVELLKKENPETSFITIQQATKGGQFRGSQEYAHNCDIIVEVISGVAHQKGRFQAASEYEIFDQPEEKKDSTKEKKAEEKDPQLNIFDLKA